MAKRRRHIGLTKEERTELERFVTQGEKSAREINRARILLLVGEGREDNDIGRILGLSRGTVYNVRQKYKTKVSDSLREVLEEEPRSGRPIAIDSRVEAKVTMLACSAPPPGRARWTLQLLADKLVKLGVTDSISQESVRQILKKTTSSPGSRNNGAAGKSRATTYGIWKTCCISINSPMMGGIR
jgi:putative transposase